MDIRSFSPSRRANLTSDSPGDGASGQMEGLLNEFKELYEAKLRRLDEDEVLGHDTQKVCLKVYLEK